MSTGDHVITPRRRHLTGADRTSAAAALKASYEQGASIRTLVGQTGRSYGTVRDLLVEAGTTLRGRGGNHRNRARRRVGRS